ncbi:hypothetical protein BG004_004913 [Podila humilis]|nr:hypothetical protein BG004_004913 [Podila humilis]
MAHSSVEQYRFKVNGTHPTEHQLISNADITTVSAKGIRRQIESLSGTSLEHVKREFDQMVMEIYQRITDEIEESVLKGSSPPQPNQNSYQNGYQQDYYQQQSYINQNPYHHQQQYSAPAPAPPPPPSQAAPTASSFGFSLPPTSYVAPKIKSEPSDDESGDSDASFSSVEGERSRKKSKVSSSGASKKTSSKKKASSVKSKSQSSSSSKKEKGKDKEKKKDKPKAKRKQPVNEDGTPKVNNFTRPMVISDKLYDVIGQAGTVGPSGRVEMARPEVVKQLWVYIKSNGLQDEADKRNIKCDSKLQALFGHDQVNCFSMNKYLSSHLSKAEELL